MKRPYDILKESLAHFRHFFSIYIGYSAWVLVPGLGIILLGLIPQTEMFDVAGLVALLLIFLGTIAIVWISIIMVHLAATLDATKSPNLQSIQTQAAKQIVPLLVVALLSGFLFIGGLILFVIPFFLMIVWYCFAQTIVILENKRGMEALTHSKSLVKGKFWYVALGMIGVPAIIFLIYTLITGGLGVLIATLSGQSLDTLLDLEKTPVWVTAMDTIGQMILIPIMSIYTTKFYLSTKESTSEKTLDASLASDAS